MASRSVFLELPVRDVDGVSFGALKDQATQLLALNANLLSTGNVSLGTTDAGKLFVPDKLVAVVEGGTVFTSDASVSLGTNAPDYNNLLAITELTGLNAIDKFIAVRLGATAIPAVPGGTQVFVKITTAAVGTGVEATFVLTGFYL